MNSNLFIAYLIFSSLICLAATRSAFYRAAHAAREHGGGRLNTLMSFQDDLSDVEIVNFVDEVDKTVREKDYDTAFKMGIDKIHEYPTCESLTYSVIMYLHGLLYR